MKDTRRTRELLELIREQNSLLAEMNKNLEQIASKEKSYREAKTKTLPSVLWI